MKKVSVFLLSCLAVSIFSCNKDEENKLADNSDPDGVNKLEEVLLDVNAVTSGISISGASKVQGSPVPNGDIAFALDYSTQSAFQSNGFNINFKAPQGFAGAYIQLKDENGMADSYFDVPVGATSGVYNKGVKSTQKSLLPHKKSSKNSKIKKGEEDTSINVDFGADVTAGTFCYLICVYDGQGYISAPSEVCVTIESWGGNVNLVADWEFTKQIENGEEIEVGEKFCEETGIDSDPVTCENGETLNIPSEYCYTIEGLLLTLNSDGTYSYVLDDFSSELDWYTSLATCELVNEEETEVYTSYGNWAYNEEEATLTLVEFQYSVLENEELESYTNEEGELVLEGDITLTTNSMVLSENYTDGDVTELYEYHFSKK